MGPSRYRLRSENRKSEPPALSSMAAKTCDVDILWGYVLNSFQRKQESYIYEKICAEHSAVRFPADDTPQEPPNSARRIPV